MPWKDVTRMEQKLEMVERWKSGLYTKVELAELSGVSRPTLDKWIERYETEGRKGLKDRSRRPHRSPHAIDEGVAERILALKGAHGSWGPRKLLDHLNNTEPEQSWPAASTVGELLDRHGLVRKRRKRRPGAERGRFVEEPPKSGEMMTADYKGEFLMGNGRYCYPLTIFDPVSRYSYAIDGHSAIDHLKARRSFRQVFERYGLPKWIKTDNGVPFSMPMALGGLSRLSVWWIKLGIEPVRIAKGSPWQNGRHERMHRTLKAETTRPSEWNLRGQQQSFDRFRTSYNEERPHEALGGLAPTTALCASPRPYPSRMPSVEYPGHFEVRKVSSSGHVKFRNHEWFVSVTLSGERVGLEEIDDEVWVIRFSTVELGRLDLRSKLLVR